MQNTGRLARHQWCFNRKIFACQSGNGLRSIVCQIRDIKSRNLRWKKQEVLKCTLYRKQSQSGQKGERARFRVKQIIKTIERSKTPLSEVSVNHKHSLRLQPRVFTTCCHLSMHWKRKFGSLGASVKSRSAPPGGSGSAFSNTFSIRAPAQCVLRAFWTLVACIEHRGQGRGAGLRSGACLTFCLEHCRLCNLPGWGVPGTIQPSCWGPRTTTLLLGIDEDPYSYTSLPSVISFAMFTLYLCTLH